MHWTKNQQGAEILLHPYFDHYKESMAQVLSARKQIANALARIQKRLADNKEDETLVSGLAEAAAAEPEEFDGSKVPVGSNIRFIVGAGESRKELTGVVLASKTKAEGEKGPDLMFKVQTGDGFDTEVKIIYPGSILGYVTKAA